MCIYVARCQIEWMKTVHDQVNEAMAMVKMQGTLKICTDKVNYPTTAVMHDARCLEVNKLQQHQFLILY